MVDTHLLSSHVPFTRIFDGTKKQKFNFAFPSMRKNQSLAFWAASGKGPALLVLNCFTRWLITWQTLLPPDVTHDKTEEANAQVCFISDISQRGFNYSLMFWLYLQTSSYKKKYIKECLHIKFSQPSWFHRVILEMCNSLYEIILAGYVLGNFK